MNSTTPFCGPASDSSGSRSSRRTLRAPVMAGVLTGLAVLGILFGCIMLATTIGKRAMRETLNEELIALAGVAATQIDAEAHARLTDPSQQNGPEYMSVVSPLKVLLPATPNLRYIYTMRRSGDELFFVTDAADPIDADGDGVIDQASLGEKLEDTDPAMFECFETGLTTVTRNAVTDQWGTFFSAYAPVRHPDGTLECVVGVDSTAHTYLSRLDRINSAAVAAMMIGGLCSIAFGIGVAFVVRKRDTTMAALESSESLLRTFVEHAPAAVAMLDMDMRYIAWSQGWTRDYDLAHQGSLSGRSHYDLFPSLPERWKQIHRECLAGAVHSHKRDGFVNPNGQVQWLEWEVRPWTRSDGRIAGIMMYTRDITSQVAGEQRIAQSEARLRAIIDGADLFAWEYCIEDDRFTYVSIERNWLGYEREQWLAQHFWTGHLHPDDRASAIARYRSEAEAGRAHRLTYRMMSASGQIVHINDYVSAPCTVDGRTILRGVAIDVSDRVRAERRLAASESLLQETGTLAKIGGWSLDPGTGKLEWSAQTRAIHDVDDSYIPTVDTAISFYAPEAQDAIRTAVEAALATGQGWDLELPFVSAKGRRLWVRAGGRAEIRDERVVRLYGAFQDVTERHDAEAALRAATEDAARLAAAIDAHSDGVMLTDAAGRVLRINSAYAALTGRTSGTTVGMIAELFAQRSMPHDGAPTIWEIVRSGHSWSGRVAGSRAHASEHGEPSLLQTSVQDGASQSETYWVDVSITPVHNKDLHLEGFVAVLRDVTQRVHAERQEQLRLEGAEARLKVAKALASESPLSERLDSALDVVFSMTGLANGRLGGLLCYDNSTCSWTPLRWRGTKCPLIDRNGDLTPYGEDVCSRLLLARDLISCDEPLHHRSAAHAGERARGAYVVPLLDQSESGSGCLGMLFLGVDPGHILGEVRRSVLREIADLIATAIMHDRASQLATLAREKAEEASRVKSAFLANMSHEIRTPMTAILGYADLLVDSEAGRMSQTQMHTYVQTIRRNGEMLMAVINDILDLSKIEAGRMAAERVPTGIADVLRDTLALMHGRAAEKNLSLNAVFDTPVPAAIQSDPLRLKQILINLVGNAIKFTDTGGVTVRVRCDGVGDDAQVRINVCDTGIGVTPEQATRIFEPFMQADTGTTRRFGGTGLGLPISRRLAELLNGSLTISSAPGCGSVFHLTLPVGPSASTSTVSSLDADSRASGRHATRARMASASSPTARPLNGLRICLAEDGADNRRLIEYHLGRAGATVHAFDNGKLALEAMTADGTVGGPLQANPRFDVVLTDMQMPEMDGYTLARTLRAKGWAGPIVALTAHAMAGEDQKCFAAGCDRYLSKPFQREDLITACRPSPARSPEHAAGA